jgi:hypothetical protein
MAQLAINTLSLRVFGVYPVRVWNARGNKLVNIEQPILKEPERTAQRTMPKRRNNAGKTPVNTRRSLQQIVLIEQPTQTRWRL